MPNESLQTNKQTNKQINNNNRDETINYIISECSKIAQKEYKTRHNCVGKVIHRELYKKFKFDYTNKWCMHNPTSVLYNHHHHHHHHHLVPLARISLTLSRHLSLSFIASGRSSGLHSVSSHSCWIYVRASRPAFAQPYVGVHKSTSLMSSSLLLQQCPTIWFV